MKNVVIFVASLLVSFCFGFIYSGNILHKRYQEAMKMSNKHLDLFMLCNKWLKLRQNNILLEGYFVKKGYKKIAIYGLGYLGESLDKELRNSSIEVVCAIDREAENIYSGLDVYSPDDIFPKIDVIVVTAISAFDQVEKSLIEKVDCDIISLEDVIEELLN